MGSYSFYGVQIGIALALGEFLLFGKVPTVFETREAVWKISFMIGGFIGLIGFYLRHRLKETPVFKLLEEKGKINHHPIFQSIRACKMRIVIGFFSTFLATVGFFALAEFPGIYLKESMGLSNAENSLIIISLLLLSAITLPIFGNLGVKYNLEKLLMFSAILILVFSPLLYYSLNLENVIMVIISWVILVLLLNFQFALLPNFLSKLFPADVRYTGIGLSFNTCDSLIGGLVPIITYSLFTYTGKPTAFSLKRFDTE